MGSELDDAPLSRIAEDVSPRLSALASRLRAAGVRCGVEELVSAHRALVELEPTRSAVRAGLRAVFCASRADVEAFERAFVEVFGPERPPAPLDPGKGPSSAGRSDQTRALSERGGVEARAARGARSPAPVEDPDPQDQPESAPARWSAIELIRDKDFRAYTAIDRRLARAELRRLAASLPMRRSARWRSVHGRGGRLDVRRTLRCAARSGGGAGVLRWRTRESAPRRLLFVCDVSGSMVPYSGMLLEYVHAVARVGREVEAFCFATRLTRVTREMRAGDPTSAIARSETKTPDRAGGTRIGAALAALNREHGARVGRGAVVIILSDGWDRGEPGLLAAEMTRLKRTAYRVIWLDPHLAMPGYEPLTRGMREALPHVHRLLAGHSLRALAQLTSLEQELLTSRTYLRSEGGSAAAPGLWSSGPR